MKKTISLLVLIAMLISCAACSESNRTVSEDTTISAETTAEAETEPEIASVSDVLDDSLDFEGADVRFLIEGGWGNEPILSSIYVESDTGDVVDTAVFNRNTIVNDYLNVNITPLDIVGANSMTKRVSTIVNASSDDCDIVGGYQAYSVGMASLGYMQNIDNLQYIDTEREYWPSQYIEDISYKGTYWVTGDMTNMYTGGLYVTYVNSRLWNNYYSEIDLYDDVRNGKWTLDYLTEKAIGVYSDLNGDGNQTLDDQLGFTLPMIDILVSGAKLSYSTRDADDTPEIAIMSERTVNFWQKAYNLMFNTTGSIYTALPTFDQFKAGTLLSTVYLISESITPLRDMEDDYYVLPIPKFDEAQESYNAQIHDNVTLFAVPITNLNADRAAAVLEAMAIESYRLLRPAYYEVALKTKYARDNETGEMIDMVAAAVTTDFVYMYSESIGGSGNGIHRVFRTAANEKKEDIVSLFESKMTLFNKKLATLLSDFEEIAG